MTTRPSCGVFAALPMLGVLDSGRGGRLALAYLRSLAPTADTILLADTANAPFGTKDEGVLRRIVTEDIRYLKERGASHVLLACCTASCQLPALDAEVCRGVYGILDATASAAAQRSKSHRYGILATAATVRSGALEAALVRHDPQASALSLAAPDLVTLSERGVADGDTEAEDAIAPLAERLLTASVDTVILGCTHFCVFRGALVRHMGHVAVISSTHAGVDAFLARIPKEALRGTGKHMELNCK